MKKTFAMVALVVLVAAPALAEEYIEFPPPTPGYAVRRSTLTGRAVVIPPYRRPLPIRIYTTPPQQPFYNVPPYAVISPY